MRRGWGVACAGWDSMTDGAEHAYPAGLAALASTGPQPCSPLCRSLSAKLHASIFVTHNNGWSGAHRCALPAACAQEHRAHDQSSRATPSASRHASACPRCRCCSSSRAPPSANSPAAARPAASERWACSSGCMASAASASSDRTAPACMGGGRRQVGSSWRVLEPRLAQVLGPPQAGCIRGAGGPLRPPAETRARGASKPVGQPQAHRCPCSPCQHRLVRPVGRQPRPLGRPLRRRRRLLIRPLLVVVLLLLLLSVLLCMVLLLLFSALSLPLPLMRPRLPAAPPGVQSRLDAYRARVARQGVPSQACSDPKPAQPRRPAALLCTPLLPARRSLGGFHTHRPALHDTSVGKPVTQAFPQPPTSHAGRPACP